MDVYKVSITEAAKQDIKGVGRHIADELQEPAIAVKTTNAILDAIETLEQMPERISLVKDKRLAAQGIRPLYVKNNTVFFRIENLRELLILYVYYTRDAIGHQYCSRVKNISLLILGNQLLRDS